MFVLFTVWGGGGREEEEERRRRGGERGGERGGGLQLHRGPTPGASAGWISYKFLGIPKMSGDVLSFPKETLRKT